jgi:hypothetical protein
MREIFSLMVRHAGQISKVSRRNSKSLSSYKKYSNKENHSSSPVLMWYLKTETSTSIKNRPENSEGKKRTENSAVRCPLLKDSK